MANNKPERILSLVLPAASTAPSNFRPITVCLPLKGLVFQKTLPSPKGRKRHRITVHAEVIASVWDVLEAIGDEMDKQWKRSEDEEKEDD